MKAVLKQNINNKKVILKGAGADVGLNSKLSAKQIELLKQNLLKNGKSDKSQNFSELLKMNLTSGKSLVSKKETKSLEKNISKLLGKDSNTKLLDTKGLPLLKSKVAAMKNDLIKNKNTKNKKDIEKKQVGLQSSENLIELSKFSKTIKKPSTYKNSSEGSFIKNAKKIEKTLELNGETKVAKTIDSMNQLGQQKMNASSSELNTDKPTLNLSTTNIENKVELMDKISDYIVTNKVATSDTASMKVQHSDLGQFEINVSKDFSSNEMSVQIVSGSQAAHDFFSVNKTDLMSSLAKSGLQIADVKLESSSDSNMNNQNGNSSSGGNKQNFQSEQNQKKQESQRRQDLWNILEERQVA